jgi:hypothetical protein
LRKRESHLWRRDPLDYYVEPEWVSRRLFEDERFIGSIYDPACGSGNIVKAAREARITAYGADIVKRWEGATAVRDFMDPDATSPVPNIVCNPPFGLCDDRRTGTHPFVERCLQIAQHKVALLLPANWVQGSRRSRWLAASPLARVWFISPRPSMPPGHIIDAGLKPGNGTTDYAWFVWHHGHDGYPQVRWPRRDPHK